MKNYYLCVFFLLANYLLLAQNYNKLKNDKHSFDRMCVSGRLAAISSGGITINQELILALLPDSLYNAPDKGFIAYSYVWKSYVLARAGCCSDEILYKFNLKDLLIEDNTLHIIAKLTTIDWDRREPDTAYLWFHLIFHLKHKYQKTFFKKMKFIELSKDSINFSERLYQSPKYEGGLMEVRQFLANQDSIPKDFIEKSSANFLFYPNYVSYGSYKMGKKGWKRIYGRRFYNKFENQIILASRGRGHTFVLNKEQVVVNRIHPLGYPIPITEYQKKTK